MAKYIKTDTIRAEQFDGSDAMAEKYHVEYDGAYVLPFRIETPEGWLGMKVGDLIATGVRGEHWPILTHWHMQNHGSKTSDDKK